MVQINLSQNEQNDFFMFEVLGLIPMHVMVLGNILGFIWQLQQG